MLDGGGARQTKVPCCRQTRAPSPINPSNRLLPSTFILEGHPLSAAVDVRGVTSPQPTPTVLLVEDSEADVLALQRTLQPLGVALVCVTSGEAAVQALAHHDFVAVL